MIMKRLIILMLVVPAMLQAQTLQECRQAAERNYPLIKQYDLIAKTTELTLSNIQKGWLPQVTATAQATYQSSVTAFPDEIQTIYKAMGIDMKGLRNDQYRIGIDVQQTVIDGGDISSRKAMAREQAGVQTAQTEVSLYSIGKRVNEMYFALLLIDEQIALNADRLTLLSQNEEKLSSMFKNGTAAESDYNNVKAERLNAEQQLADLRAQRATLARMLSTFCGIEVNESVKPAAADVTRLDASARPELKLIDSRLRLYDAQEKALNAALMPKLGVFAQGFYGYPGYNMFEGMMNRRWTLNAMIGARLTWSIGALYTRRADKAKLQLQRDNAAVERDVFLFNNRLEQIQQSEDIERYRKLMAADEEIIKLRTAVRTAAESKLIHGIIDSNDLVKEINAENAARLRQSMHEIEMLKEIYDLKYTIND